MKWGLVPHWQKHEDNNLNTMNARSENLLGQGSMWGSLKGRKRCLVIADGYALYSIAIPMTFDVCALGTMNGSQKGGINFPISQNIRMASPC
jgi:hypothetical protein